MEVQTDLNSYSFRLQAYKQIHLEISRITKRKVGHSQGEGVSVLHRDSISKILLLQFSNFNQHQQKQIYINTTTKS